MRFASNTSVAVSKSSGEITDMVTKAGGTSFAVMQTDGRAIITFELNERRIMFELKLPLKEKFTKKKDRWGREKSVPLDVAFKLWEQACRSAWRGLVLTVKSKLVSVDMGIETFEEAFLAQIVVAGSDGRAKRFSEFAIKAIAQSYTSGKLPPLLGSGT